MDDDAVNPLPYIITFGILVIIALAALTWMLSQWYRETQCVLDPNIWCSDQWTCNRSCPTGYPGNQCFVNLGPTGLASCIFGPDAPGATVCLTPPTQGTGTACNCPASLTGIQNNCLSGCPLNLGDVNQQTICPTTGRVQ